MISYGISLLYTSSITKSNMVPFLLIVNSSNLMDGTILLKKWIKHLALIGELYIANISSIYRL